MECFCISPQDINPQLSSIVIYFFKSLSHNEISKCSGYSKIAKSKKISEQKDVFSVCKCENCLMISMPSYSLPLLKKIYHMHMEDYEHHILLISDQYCNRWYGLYDGEKIVFLDCAYFLNTNYSFFQLFSWTSERFQHHHIYECLVKHPLKCLLITENSQKMFCAVSSSYVLYTPFKKFLDDHNCSYMFTELFGIIAPEMYLMLFLIQQYESFVLNKNPSPSVSGEG